MLLLWVGFGGEGGGDKEEEHKKGKQQIFMLQRISPFFFLGCLSVTVRAVKRRRRGGRRKTRTRKTRKMMAMAKCYVNGRERQKDGWRGRQQQEKFRIQQHLELEIEIKERWPDNDEHFSFLKNVFAGIPKFSPHCRQVSLPPPPLLLLLLLLLLHFLRELLPKLMPPSPGFDRRRRCRHVGAN